MKYLKALALAAVAAALMAMAGVGAASATVFCSTTADPCPSAQKWAAGTAMDWSIPSGKSVQLVSTTGEELDTCSTQTKKWKITNAGGALVTVTGEEEETTWGSCTFPTKILTLPKWEVHQIAGTSNGTLTSEGTTEITINTIFFGSCIYGATSGTSVGDITEGKPAVLHTNAVSEKFSGSNLACPSTAKLTATLTLTEPANTTLSVSSS